MNLQIRPYDVNVLGVSAVAKLLSFYGLTNQPAHEITNNVVCATSKASDQPAQSDQSPCLSLDYSMTVQLLTEHHLEFLSLKGGCTGSSESALVKMPHCWRSHGMAQMVHDMTKPTKRDCA